MDFSSIKIIPNTLNEEEEEVKFFARRARRIILVRLDNDNRRMSHSKDPRPLYFGGEEIFGTISIEIIGGRPVRHVKLALISLAQICWCSQHQMDQHHGTSSITKRKKSIFSDYFMTPDEKQIFFNREKILEFDLLNSNKTLIDGKYELPFRFQLPKAGLPSSMKSPNGLIKYTIEAFTIDEETFNESRGEKEIIFLVPILDLRQINRKTEKTFMNFDGGELEVSAMLERKIFKPGDILSLEISINNDSTQDLVLLISIYQRQIITNCQNENIKQQTYEICLNSGSDEMSQAVMIPVEPYGKLEQEPIKIRLPQNLVFSLECSLIMVKYHILITINNSALNNIPSSSSPAGSMEIPFLISLMDNNFGQRKSLTKVKKFFSELEFTPFTGKELFQQI